MVKTFCRITTSILFLVCVLISVLSFNQIREDRKFQKNALFAPAQFIDDFKERNERLPTNKEFRIQYKDDYNTNYIIVDEELQHYEINVWRGEWPESYVSKTDSVINSNSEMWFVKTGIVVFLIGAFPGLLYLYFYHWKPRQTNT